MVKSMLHYVGPWKLNGNKPAAVKTWQRPICITQCSIITSFMLPPSLEYFPCYAAIGKGELKKPKKTICAVAQRTSCQKPANITWISRLLLTFPSAVRWFNFTSALTARIISRRSSVSGGPCGRSRAVMSDN